MEDLPYGATITLDPVANYAHLKEPFRSKWIQCITCKQVPTETVYSVHIPAQVQGDKRSHGVRTVCCSEECAHKWIAAYKADEDTHHLRYGSNYTPIYRASCGPAT